MKISSVAAPIRNAISHSSRRSSTFSMRISPDANTSRRRVGVAVAICRYSRRPLLRLEPCFLVDQCERFLADPRLVLLVDRHDGLLPGCLLGGRQRDDFRLAGRL